MRIFILLTPQTQTEQEAPATPRPHQKAEITTKIITLTEEESTTKSLNKCQYIWEGSEPDIWAVVGLTSESIDKKTLFEILEEKLENYVTGELRSGRKIGTMMRHNKNPTDEHNNTKPTYDETASDSDKKMWYF